MSLFTELKRRNVFRVGLTYLVVAWLLIQIANNVVAPLGLPAWTTTLVIVLLALGFPVALILAWAFELTPEGLKRESEKAGENVPVRAFGRKWDFVIIAGLIVALGYFVWDRYGGQHPVQQAEATGVTLAVLPFEDLSPNKDQGYFADGIAEQLLDSLSRVNGLEVTARTSSFYFKGKNEDMRTIGRELSVENLLEGSVRKEGDQVRITTQLINAETGYHLWSQTYDRKLTDIFAVQDEIAMSVADALQVTLGVGAVQVPGMTRNVEAYEEFMKAGEADSLQHSIDHLERALVLDPMFSVARIYLAATYYDGAASQAPDKAAEWRKRAFESVAKAQQLTPDAPEVLLGVASIDEFQGKFREAAATYEKFPKIAAKYGLENSDFEGGGIFLWDVGRVQDAMKVFERAKAASPLDWVAANRLAQVYDAAGRPADALAELDRGQKIGGVPEVIDSFALLTALATRDRAEIDKRLAAIKQANGSTSDVHLAMAQYLDRPNDAPAEIRRQADDIVKRKGALANMILAGWAAYYGDAELALDLERKFYESGITRDFVAQSLWRPILRDARKLPVFKDLVTKMGLVDYWRAYSWPDFCHPVGDKDFECN
jgi:TolB-like protein